MLQDFAFLVFPQRYIQTQSNPMENSMAMPIHANRFLSHTVIKVYTARNLIFIRYQNDALENVICLRSIKSQVGTWLTSSLPGLRKIAEHTIYFGKPENKQMAPCGIRPSPKKIARHGSMDHIRSMFQNTSRFEGHISWIQPMVTLWFPPNVFWVFCAWVFESLNSQYIQYTPKTSCRQENCSHWSSDSVIRSLAVLALGLLVKSAGFSLWSIHGWGRSKADCVWTGLRKFGSICVLGI